MGSPTAKSTREAPEALDAGLTGEPGERGESPNLVTNLVTL